jgi:hypothetical protein
MLYAYSNLLNNKLFTCPVKNFKNGSVCFTPSKQKDEIKGKANLTTFGKEK